MSWEIIVIGCLVLVIFGIAVWAMRKTKSEFNSFGGTPVNTDDLARKIAKATGAEIRLVFKEFIEELKKLPLTAGTHQRTRLNVDETWGSVDMDESIIPIDIEVDVESTNLEGAAAEQKVVDKNLGKSKSKLAGLFKNRTKE